MTADVQESMFVFSIEAILRLIIANDAQTFNDVYLAKFKKFRWHIRINFKTA